MSPQDSCRRAQHGARGQILVIFVVAMVAIIAGGRPRHRGRQPCSHQRIAQNGCRLRRRRPVRSILPRSWRKDPHRTGCLQRRPTNGQKHPTELRPPTRPSTPTTTGRLRRRGRPEPATADPNASPAAGRSAATARPARVACMPQGIQTAHGQRRLGGHRGVGDFMPVADATACTCCR